MKLLHPADPALITALQRVIRSAQDQQCSIPEDPEETPIAELFESSARSENSQAFRKMMFDRFSRGIVLCELIPTVEGRKVCLEVCPAANFRVVIPGQCNIGVDLRTTVKICALVHPSTPFSQILHSAIEKAMQ